MAKGMDNVTGGEVNVREDTAKAYRGVYWALLSVGAFILIAAILFFGGLLSRVSDNNPTVPATGPSHGEGLGGSR